MTTPSLRGPRRGLALLAVMAAGAAAVGAATASAGAPLSAGSPVTAPAAGAQHLIVRGADGRSAAAVAALVTASGGTVTRELPLVGAVSATLPARAASALAASGIASVTPDAAVTLDSNGYSAKGDGYSLVNIESQAGLRNLWQQGTTGAGVDVAVVDSGVAPVAGLDPSRLVIGPDLTEEAANPKLAGLDTFGHGTFMAGIIAGHDAAVTDVSKAKNDTDDFLGVAPNARIVSVKAADFRGSSTVSQVIAGIDWTVQHAHDNGLNIKVLNLSFGADSSQAYTNDPLAYAVEQAWKAGIVVVVSAGNTGNSSGHLSDPAYDPYVLAVGAADTGGSGGTGDDTVASFSAQGDGTRNPDLIAPGAHIQSLRVPGSWIDSRYGSTGQVDARFFRGSGTSEAAAFASGTVALLAQLHPSWTPDQLKAAVTAHPHQISNVSPRLQGAGILDVKSLPTKVVDGTQSFAASSAAPPALPPLATGSWSTSKPIAALSWVAADRTLAFWGNVNTPELLATWGGSGWVSSTWNSSTWDSSTWNSSTWNSSTWSSSTWDSSTWSSSTWSSSTWSSSTWSTRNWG